MIHATLDQLIRRNYKLAPFIPNGRFLPLDLKRAGICPKTIFDVGANIGQTANHFAQHFPVANIYSFEPVPGTFTLLKQNTQQNLHIHSFNEGLGSAIQQLTIHKNDASGSSSLRGNDGRFYETETVEINTGAHFCDQNAIDGIDLLKMDVEGFECEVLTGFGALLGSKVKLIYTEIGFEKDDRYKTYIGDLLELVYDHGFIVSGFYEPYRWGKGKLKVFHNMLLVNKKLIEL